MAIEGFDYNAFAIDLSSQAVQILHQETNAAPNTLSEENKTWITETIKRFCIMAGEALSNEEQTPLNAAQASLITQFIGEWTFHKSIDIISSNIPEENREPILQIIAANIFNVAKLAILKNMPQDQLITLVENKVAQVYKQELEKLVQKGVLSEEQGKEAATHSNLNDMVQKTQEIEKQQKIQQEQALEAKIEDKKSLKFIALAIVLKRLGDDRANEILNAMGEDEVKQITNYMKMSDIEKKIPSSIMLKSLNEIKKIIPMSDTINVQRILNRFHKTIKAATPEILNNISINERENVKDFILDDNFPALEVFSPRVLSIIAKTLEDRINDNKEKVR